MWALLFGIAAGAIVRRAGDEVQKTASRTANLCQSEHISAVCNAMQGNADGLQELMTSRDSDTRDFLRAVNLGESFSCQELCMATLAFAESEEGGRVSLPPANAVVCTDADCTHQVSVSEQDVAAMAVQELEAVTVSANGLMEDESTDDVQEMETEDEPEPGDLTFTPQEMTRSLMVLFDVFAVPDSDPAAGFLEDDEESLLESEGVNDPEFGPKIRRDRYRLLTTFAAKGTALVSTAIRRVDSNHQTIYDWFGDEADPREVKNMFQKQLKTILDLRIKKGDCSGSTLAYVMVWTNTRTGDFARSDRDSKGQYVVHMCEYFWAVIRDTDYRYGTIIHESAHHHGPTDVKLGNGQTAYGRRNNLRLVQEQGPHGNGRGRGQGTMSNADNFMTAVLELARDEINRPLPEPEADAEEGTEWHEAAICNTACGATHHLGRSLKRLELEPNQCAACEWVTRERWGGSGCGSGFSLGEKTFLKKVCCHPQSCKEW